MNIGVKIAWKCFFEFLREHGIKIMSFKKKKMKLLTKKPRKYMKMLKFAVFVKQSLKINVLKIKNIPKLEIIVTVQANTELEHIVYVI